MKKEKWLIALAAGAGVAAVTYKLLSADIPNGAEPVQPFDMNRYLGMWYEVARLPSRIEKNINQLTEEYSYNEDGTLKVVTKGYSVKKKEWKEYSGKIKFADNEDIGKLKVSYFGPFYLSYNILDLDEDYKYALVSGSGLDYLWILSRETTISPAIRTRFLKKAQSIGFAIDKLEWV